MSARHLILSWDDDEGTVVIDSRGLSPYDVVGILSGALELAKDELPVPSFLELEEEEPSFVAGDDEEGDDE